MGTTIYVTPANDTRDYVGYDVELSFHGKTYYLLDDWDGAISDINFTERKVCFRRQ